ncbi:MAG TPA: hypothetical protein VFS30_08965 [Dehalococcoidia bacterium]|nr:hypothetical protein [Dehalococcoidia bacterium]
MSRRPQPVRPDPLRLTRLRKRGELRHELDGAERLHEPRTAKETAIYGVILLAALIVVAAIVIRIA